MIFMPKRSRLSKKGMKPRKERLLAWKASLKKVGDNADYIEWNMAAIQKELNKNDPDTAYMRSKIKNIIGWFSEIDKFHAHSGKDMGYSKIVQVYPKVKK